MATFDGERMTLDGLGDGYVLERSVLALASDLIEIGGRMGEGSGMRQIAIAAEETTSAYYYCELYDSGTDAFLGLTSTLDDVSYDSIATVAAQRPLEDGAITLALDNRPPLVACATTWPADAARIDGPIPSGVVPGSIALIAARALVELDYLIQIRTG